MESVRVIHCSIWTRPFDKIGFSQLNMASASIIAHCRFFSARTEEIPEMIALNYVLIALDFSANSVFSRSKSDVWSLLRTDLYSESSCFKLAISALGLAINLFVASRAFLVWILSSLTQRTSSLPLSAMLIRTASIGPTGPITASGSSRNMDRRSRLPRRWFRS